MSDDDFRTPEERQADDDEAHRVLEFALLGLHVDNHQAALERIADEDPVGFAAFADRPGWVEKRLAAPE